MTAAILAWILFFAPQNPPDAGDPPSPQLAGVKRVYVDRLTAGDGSAQIRDLLLSALHAAKLFAVTENEERADAYLRGGAEDLVFTENFNYREGVDARASASLNRAEGSRPVRRDGRAVSLSVGEDESLSEQKRRHEAVAAIRLVSKDGDIIWATTKESSGTKVKSAQVDLVDKLVLQLKQDFEKARAQPKP
jgi:hypothetical protein